MIGQQSLLTIADPPPTTPLVKGGQVRALAVTSTKRLDDLPDVPTMAEAGVPGIDVGLWSGVFAPAGTPPAIVKKLETEFRKMMQIAGRAGEVQGDGDATVGGSAADFAHTIEVETKMWGEVGRLANVKLE